MFGYFETVSRSGKVMASGPRMHFFCRAELSSHPCTDTGQTQEVDTFTSEPYLLSAAHSDATVSEPQSQMGISPPTVLS